MSNLNKKEKNENSGRLDNLTKLERIGVYILPFAIIFNVINAINVPAQPAGTPMAFGFNVSMGIDLVSAFCMAGLWLYLFSGRSLTAHIRNSNNKQKND
ncbi:MAG: hypothetical protein AAFV98_08945 [Chloroflexota bacterium]